MGRIIAIDYGTKRTGIAVSDPLRIIATGLENVPTANLGKWVKDYIAANNVDIIVIGKAVKMDGLPSDTLPAAEALAAKLEKEFPQITVVMFDERFTSVLAQRSIIESGVKKMQRRDKAAVDVVSATIILQGFMDSRLYDEINKKQI